MENNIDSRQLESLIKSLRKDIRKSVEDIRINYIYSNLLGQYVFERPEPLLAMSESAIAPEFAWWLYRYVSVAKPINIVELGSGVSTVVIASALKKNGSGKLISYESDTVYYEKTKKLVFDSGLQEYVNLIYAPLEKIDLDGELYNWYSVSLEDFNNKEDGQAVDFLFVDGPRGATNYLARYPAYPFFKSMCNNETLIILDDAFRKDEEEIIRRWVALNKTEVGVRRLDNFRHGPALLFSKLGSVEAKLDMVETYGVPISYQSDCNNEQLFSEIKELKKALRAQRKEISGLNDRMDGFINYRFSSKDKLYEREKNSRFLKKKNNAVTCRVSKEKVDIEKLLAFQLGSVILNLYRTPLGWLKMPVGFYRVIKRYKKNSGTTSPDVNVTSGQSIHSSVKKALRVNKTATIFTAFSMVKEKGWETAIAYAEERALPFERDAIFLLRAAANEGDEIIWLRNFNAYIKKFDLSPLELVDESNDRFFRITSKPPKIIDVGPLVTVIMPAFNAEMSLSFAANSILKQSWKNLELIIVDDCSTDRTLAIANDIAHCDMRVKVLHNPVNVGPYVSKNLALRIAKGSYITGHDADDWAHPQRLEKHLGAVLEELVPPKASLMGMVRVNLNGVITRVSKPSINTVDGATASAFISCLFEAAFLKEQLGSWDEVKFAGDSELIKRAETLLGHSLKRYDCIGMICLDREGSLTNDPVHGYNPNSGISESRLAYRTAFSDWHKSAGSLYMPFPQSNRLKNVPSTVRVSASAVKDVLAYHERAYKESNVRCDVLIITDFCFPGGNASSTIDEIRFFEKEAKTITLIHCPIDKNVNKKLSDRYSEWSQLIKLKLQSPKIDAKFVIIRHPAVICSKQFESLQNSFRAQFAIFVINNSIVRSNGEEVYSLNRLMETFSKFDADNKKVFPIGPVIRKELEGAISDDRLARFDWNPTFDSSIFKFSPKQTIEKPYVIGRHGRDGVEKWIESPSDLKSIYPSGDDFVIRILGGADRAFDVIGYRPDNWDVLAFGEMAPEVYLKNLDVFVYFPHSSLNEAFGRTVLEAIFVGVPCILPLKLKETFGDLAFYCNPEDVSKLIDRLASSPLHRSAYVASVRKIAERVYETNNLRERLKYFEMPIGEHYTKKKVHDELFSYKEWVEMGCGDKFY